VRNWGPAHTDDAAPCTERVPVPYTTRHGHAIRTSNHPEMVDRYMAFVKSTAEAAGSAAEVAAFDTAAAAFPTPPPLVAATLVERGNLIMREPPAWESDFLQWREERRDARHGDLPDEFWENYGVIDDELKPSYKEMVAKGAKGGAATNSPAAAGSAAGDFDMFEDPDAEDDDTLASTAAESFKAAPRETEADKIRDTKSLDRALDSRLVLLVKGAEGHWSVPAGSRREGERMVEAAARHAQHALGPDVNLWFPGNAPMGVRLRVFDEATQKATGCYGAKVFFYRAEILNGRPTLPAAGDGLVMGTRDEALPEPLDQLLNRQTHA
ncbi:MRPL46, partial [Symbiodinium sp. KB8]